MKPLAAGLCCVFSWGFLIPAVHASVLEVTITSPPPGEPVFGEVEFAADVYPPGTEARVVFYIDGSSVGDWDHAPYRVQVDVGQDNREHRFKVEARDGSGALSEALLVTPAFEINEVVAAELQQLYVTVSDGETRVLDLTQDDFAILDEGNREAMVTFARGDVRLTAAILIDSSSSMRGDRLRYALRGAAAFIDHMAADDDASILLFSDRLVYSTPFSNDSGVLTRGLQNVNANGGTALNDHLYLALKRLEAEQGRRVVIILSDGIDSHSVLRMPEVTWLARRSRALVYWIRPEPGSAESSARFSAWKDAGEYRDEYRQLTQTVLESGGRVVNLANIAEAEGAFREILRELREQYVLGYYPGHSRNDGSWHQVLVRLRRDGLRVRTQSGYIDY